MVGGNVPSNLGPIFQAAGAQEHIPASVLAGIASVESNFGANKGPSSAGAVGTMQFEPSTARGLGINPLDDRQAIFGAAKLLNQYGYQRDPFRAIGAYNGGPGNPQAGYARQVLSEAQRVSAQLGGSGTGASSFGVPSVSRGGPDWSKIGVDALLHDTGGNILRRMVSDETSGNFGTSSTANFSMPNIKVPPGGGDINPLMHFTLGRTDMGVDANAAPGTPIRAMNDSAVTAILHGWYKGQDLVEMRLTAGPNAGKTWYISEQISHSLKVGQHLIRGQQIATYAPTGTGVEIGWGSPSGNGETLAQATGNTGDSSHANAPAGISFRQTLAGLGA